MMLNYLKGPFFLASLLPGSLRTLMRPDDAQEVQGKFLTGRDGLRRRSQRR